MSGRCVICEKPSTPAYRPFCSNRCANVDLQRWLTGAYALPTEEEEGRPIEDSAGDSGAG